MASKFRIMLLFSGFALLSGLLIFRAFQLQVIPSKNVETLAHRQLHKTIEIVGRRGSLKDRRGRELAVSVNTVSLFVNPHLVKDVRRLSLRLSQILGISSREIFKKVTDAKSRKFIWLSRQLNYEQNLRLKRFGIKDIEGVGVLPEYRRDYPNAHLAAQVLGYVSVDGLGLGGLERQFDLKLSGARQTLKVQRDAKGRPIFSHTDQIRLEDLKGEDITLTIDSALQSRVDQSLKDAVERHEADSALAIGMNPKSGEILFISHYPFFNPNQAGIFSSESRRIRALSDPVEPGSVLKPFVVAEALEQNKVTPFTKISGGGGQIKIGRKIITESDKKHNADYLTVRDLLKYSSNVATVNLQKRIGFDSIAERFKKLGFRETTGIELPAESRGIFNIPGPRQELEKATISYGHGIALTPIQIIRAWASLANGGYMIRPTLLLNQKTEALDQQIFSTSTVQQMLKMLERVVHNEGTGIAAKVEGYRVAGKTGTSIKVSRNGGYEAGAYWSSFAGIFPSDSPEIVVYVGVDNPRVNGKYASAVAAPLFAEVIAAYLSVGRSAAGLQKDLLAETQLKTLKMDSETLLVGAYGSLKQRKIPSLAGLTLTQAMRVLESENINVEIENMGKIVWDQMPEPGTRINGTQKVHLKLKD